jgi:thiol reductant ABC exporter CydC subunit
VALAVWLLPAAGAILALALIVGGLVVPWLVTRFGAASSRRVAPAKGLLAAEVVDVLAASADIAACGARDRVLAQVARADDALTAAENRNSGAAGLAAGLGALATGAAVVGAVLVAVPAVRSGQLAGVNLAVVVLLPLAAFEAVLAMPTAALALVSVRQAATRVFALTDAPAAVHEAESPVALPTAAEVAGQAGASGTAGYRDSAEGRPVVPRRREVVMSGVSAAYPDASDDAITDISLRLTPGHRTALIGPSGSGKSTVAAVLERFLDYRGSIRLDGVELRQADSDQVRTIIGSCGQDAHIFDNTIGENVRLARRSATDGEVLAALDAARLGDWVRTLPAGLETPVGAHGAALSGGQRQRVALARALLADFEVLLLDEPTEHLDGPTADRLMADLLTATAGRATLVITHREQDLVGCDDVVTIAAGRMSGSDGQVGK